MGRPDRRGDAGARLPIPAHHGVSVNQPTICALLAVLVLTAALNPGRAAASSDADAVSLVTITNTLYPGWNMVGWTGPDTPISDLFQALPDLERVSAWDARYQRYSRSTRNSTGRGMSLLAKGRGLWLYLGGDEPVEWTRVVSSNGVLLSLHSGRNLVGWAGDAGATIEAAMSRFGGKLVHASRWDAKTQQYERYDPGVDAAGSLTELRAGDALWVELTDATWWRSGTAGPNLVFSDEFSKEDRAAFSTLLESAQAVFAEQYSVHTSDFTVKVDGTECDASVHTIRLSPNCARQAWIVAHEYFHVLQHQLALPQGITPTWITEGSARYAEAVYAAVMGSDPGIDRRISWTLDSVHMPETLDDLEDRETFYDTTGGYSLGALAIDWLVARLAPESFRSASLQTSSFAERFEHNPHVEYYRLLRTSETWQHAFETAFGISMHDFINQFELYRETVAFEASIWGAFGVSPEDFNGDLEKYRNIVGQPLAHSTDEVVEPTVVFVGDVPAATRADVETQMTRVYELLTGRIGFEPYEFSLYVAADDDPGRLAYFELYRSDALRGMYPRCTIFSTFYIFHPMTCEDDLTYKDFIGMPFTQLLSSTSYQHHPHWLRLAGKHYASALYRDVWRLGSLDDEIESAELRTAAYETPIEQLETHAGWVDGDNRMNWSLTLVAAHWLSRQAGEQALIEYYGLLPRGDPNHEGYEPAAGSWQAAFEQAFGLTIEDFYDQFEAYRKTLTTE